MDKILKPEKLRIDPNDSSAGKEFKHWKRCFENYVSECVTVTADNAETKKLQALTNMLSCDIYDYIDECNEYTAAMAILEKVFVKAPSEIYARYKLRNAKQANGQSLEDFRRTLGKIAKDCNFKDVNAAQYKQEMMRDSLISGILSGEIRRRLLEETELTFDRAFNLAVTYSDANSDSKAIECQAGPVSEPIHAMTSSLTENRISDTDDESSGVLAMSSSSVCNFCGSRKPHVWKNCIARQGTCHKCHTVGHWARACPSKKGRKKSSQKSFANAVVCAMHNAVSSCLSHALVDCYIQGKCLNTIVDTGASKNYIDVAAAHSLHLEIQPCSLEVGFAQASLKQKALGVCYVDVCLHKRVHRNIEIFVLKDLCSQLLLGKDFQQKFKRVIFETNGPEDDLVINGKQSNEICVVAKANVQCPPLFGNLMDGCTPIATKSRQFSKDNRAFIKQEVQKWLSSGICRPSNSPWRAQIVVVIDPLTGKRRLCIDFSQTINLYTELDAYPIPLIEDIVNKLAGYKLYATYDLKSAYHQIPIREEDSKFTAFEANGKLYEMVRIPFGVKNGGPCFQRVMDSIVAEDGLSDTFVYFDNVIIGASDAVGLKQSSDAFIRSMASRNMTLNESKTIYGVPVLPILGYCVGNNEIRPDPDRLKALHDMPPPSSSRSLQRALGFFAYYAKWIVNFSDCINKLKSVDKFPLSKSEVNDFNSIKAAIANATLSAIDEDQPFTVECDASDVAVSATLNQNGRPVAFMSRTLQGSELHYPAMEKEATSIIEAVRKWSHLLIRRQFTIITDQRSVAFMFDSRKRTKVKNNKVLCWRLELAPFSYSIQYRPGVNNVAPDALSRTLCASVVNTASLMEIHKNLGCPGVTRLVHFVRAKNLPYSVEDCKKVCKTCPSCAETKPRFYSVANGTLIKATKPMERLNLDFKGPVSSTSRNKFILCIVDEYSRFPFCFACPDISSKTVINCLTSLFTLFGTSSYVHSDRGKSFRSQELRDFLIERSVAYTSLPHTIQLEMVKLRGITKLCGEQ